MVNALIKQAHKLPEELYSGQRCPNITGEKLSVNQVIDAVQYPAARTTDVSPAHFEADAERSRYILRVVEFVGRTDASQLLAFLREVDRYLKQVNTEYRVNEIRRA